MWNAISNTLSFQVITLAIAVILLMMAPFIPTRVAQAQSNTIQHEDSKPISQHAFERLPNNPGVDPDHSIHQTTLTSGKEFRENLPRTIDSDLRQLAPGYDPGEPNAQTAVKQAQDTVRRASQQAQQP